MAPFLRGMSRRDAILILVGAFSMQLFSSFVPFDRASITMKLEHQFDSERFTQNGSQDLHNQDTESSSSSQADLPPSSAQVPIEYAPELPETTIVSHAPGWTLFRDLYMANGTLFIVSSAPQSSFPELRYMTSTPLTAINSPENIAAREPTREHLDFLTPRRARRWWGGDVEHGERNRVWTVEGNTILQNDPNQFLDHYYHFVAELVLGIWAFWQGTFTPAWSYIDPTALPPRTDIIPGPIIAPREPIDIPQIDRLIFAHAFAEEWRDKPGFNGYFFRAAFPSIDIEEEYDWIDRVKSTSAPTGQTLTKAWHFPHLLLIDRSAAFRGGFCGLQNSRTAAEPVEKMRGEGRLAKNWWSDVRRKVMDFARAPADIMEATVTDVETGKEMTMPKKVVVTYISRQDVRRHLIQEDHELLVQSLQELVQRKNSDWVSGGTENGREWELNIIKPETMTKDEQVAVASRTTILLGVHGNGLTHLVLMAPSPISTVIEMLYPGGFAHDYEWTAKALGMKHFGIWNDTSFTEPNIPSVEYVEGFQGTSIPVYGPLVAKIIEDRVAGLL